MSAISPVEHRNNTSVVQSDVQQTIKMEPEHFIEIEVKEECIIQQNAEADETWQRNDINLKEDNENAEVGLLPRLVNVKCETKIEIEIEPYEMSTTVTNEHVQEIERSDTDPGMSRTIIKAERENSDLNENEIHIKSENDEFDSSEEHIEYDESSQWTNTQVDPLSEYKSSHDIPLKTKIVLQRCDGMKNEKQAPRRVTQRNLNEDTTSDNGNELTVGKTVSRSRFGTTHKQLNEICVTGDKKYECDFCNKHFDYKSRLIAHIRIHTGDKPFKCNICFKSFFRKSHLDRHTRVHNGDKPHKCNTCNKSFTEKSKLVRHSHIHTGDKPYKCNTCNKCFTQKSILVRHNQIHTGDKPYKCNVCSKGFVQNSDLVKHNRIHTGVKPFQCNICTNSFVRKSLLDRHTCMHTGDPYK